MTHNDDTRLDNAIALFAAVMLTICGVLLVLHALGQV